MHVLEGSQERISSDNQSMEPNMGGQIRCQPSQDRGCITAEGALQALSSSRISKPYPDLFPLSTQACGLRQMRAYDTKLQLFPTCEMNPDFAIGPSAADAMRER